MASLPALSSFLGVRGLILVLLAIVVQVALRTCQGQEELQARYGKAMTLEEITALPQEQRLTAVHFALERRVQRHPEDLDRLSPEGRTVLILSRLEVPVGQRGFDALRPEETTRLSQLSDAYERIGLSAFAQELRYIREHPLDRPDTLARRWAKVYRREKSLAAQQAYLETHLNAVWGTP